MKNGLKLCSHLFYGGFIVVGGLDKTPVKKQSTAKSIRFDLSGYTHTELFSNFEPVQTDNFAFESNISSPLFLLLFVTYFPSHTCTFH